MTNQTSFPRLMLSLVHFYFMSLNKQNAAARLAKLPLVRSACANLSLLCGDAKSVKPGLGSVWENLESCVAYIRSAACHRLSPVVTKFKPQDSFANDVACKSLDWLEATFPVLHTSTDQLAAGVRSKVLEIQDAATIVAHGTVDCMQHVVTCIVEKVQQHNDHLLGGRAVTASSTELGSALNLPQALVDRMLQLTEEEKKENVLMDSSETAASMRWYSVRLVTLSITLCRRTIQLAGAKIQSTQIMEAFSTSSQFRILLALAWSLEQLPLHVQQQIVSVFFYFTQMYNLGGARQSCSKQDKSVCPSEAGPKAKQHKVIKSPRPNSNWRVRRPGSISVYENRLTPLE